MPRKIGRNRHGTYPARWWEGDTKRSRNFDTKEERDDFLKDLRDGFDPQAGEEQFSDFAQRWAVPQDWTATSRQGWEQCFKRLDRHLGDMPLVRIDPLVLKGLQQNLAVEDGYARNTVILTMAYAKSVMKAAYAAGAIKRDPTLGLKPPKVRDDDDRDKDVSPEEVPSRAEVLAILDAAPAPFRAAIALGVNGLRIGEIIGITKRQILFDSHELLVDQQLQRIKVNGVWVNRIMLPKREKKRTIGLPQAVSFVLRRHLEAYPPEDDEWGGLLFRGARGAEMRRTYIYDQCWKPALVGAGLAEDRFKFHSLRHFAASSMLADTVPITAVAAHLGDTVETVERTYAHWLRDEKDVPAQLLDRVLAPVIEESADDSVDVTSETK